MRRRILVAALMSALAFAAHAQEVPQPLDVPYAPGMMKVEVDATNLSQRIFGIKQTIPVQAGPLTLLFPRWVPGGHPMNPLGVRALYLGSSMYRIHGTDAPWTIGTNVSSGCIRLRNEDVVDLYERVDVGTKVIVM